MIYIRLFWEFLKIGMFSFGGAYGAIPVIRDGVLNQGWMTEEMFENVLAISESTPGPIMINAATYIGGKQAGIPGAAAATLGVVLPSFLIILLVAMFLRKWLKNNYVQAVFGGIKPAVAGIILATGIYMVVSGVTGINSTQQADYKEMTILLVLSAIALLWQKIKKKELSPIPLILISAGLGIVLDA